MPNRFAKTVSPSRHGCRPRPYNDPTTVPTAPTTAPTTALTTALSATFLRSSCAGRKLNAAQHVPANRQVGQKQTSAWKRVDRDDSLRRELSRGMFTPMNE